MSKALSKLFAFLLILAIALSTLSGLSVQRVQSAPGRGVTGTTLPIPLADRYLS